MELANATVCHDDQFGPTVSSQSCRGGFDFTLLFQESILTLLPTAVFLTTVAPRALYLLRRTDKAKRRATYAPKLIALLALTASVKLLNTRLSIAVAVLNVLASCSIVLLSHMEHVKTIRPSFLLTAYLILSALFDAARIRTEWLLSVNTGFTIVLSFSLACKIALLALETTEKRRILIDGTPLSSESTSGPLNRSLFLWLNSLFFRGWKGTLTLASIPRINEKLDSESVAARFKDAEKRVLHSQSRRRLLFATVHAIKWDLLFIVPPRLAMVALRLSQPFLISHALRYLTAPDGAMPNNLGYGLIGAFALVFLGSALIQAWYEHLVQRTGAIVRGGLITLIYSKMLRLPTANLNQSSAVTLMGNDVETLVSRLRQLLIEWWAGSLTVGIATWMLANQLGAICVVPLIAVLASLIMSAWVGKSMGGRLKIYQQAAQDRINFTTQVISSLKAVKMLGYVQSFTRLIREKRRQDLRSGRRYRWLSVADNAVVNLTNTQAQTITFGAYAIVAKLSGSENFTASQAAVVLSILNVLMTPLRELLYSVTASVSAFAAFERIQDFLCLDERLDERCILECGNQTLSRDGGSRPRTGIPSILISDGSFSWGKEEVLQSVNATIPSSESGSLTMVIGPVGSGKSNLLKSLLGETSCSKGSMTLEASEIAFCDQIPWLINASIRDNIVAGSGALDETWFNAVVEACDLRMDLDSLAKGPDTLVGDNGVKLSGGQKQRMAIARAIYSRKKIAIFDNVFSGLDKVTEQTVFARVFAPGGLLKKQRTTVILATHAVNRLPQSDYVIALDSGRITQQGRFQDLQLSQGYVSQLKISDDRIDSESEQEEDQNAERLPEKMSNEVQEAEKTPQVSTDRSVFMYYFKAVRRANMALLTLIAASTEAAFLLRFVWLTWWGEGRGHSSNDLGYWLGLFAALGILQDALTIGLIAMFLTVLGPVSGYILHNRVLNAVMNASMSFLSNTQTGTLVNRFSQDMRLIDLDLPISLGVFIADLCSCLGALGLAIGAVSWFGLAVPPIIFVMVLTQRFYVRTSKQLRLLETEHKAPLYSHFLESITGLATIRAFGWTSQYQAKNLRLLNDAQKPSYLMGCVQRWLALVMELVVALLTILLVTLAVTFKGKFPPSLLGVALVNMMSLGDSLQGVLIHWSALETSLGAVSRVKSFTETTPSELSVVDDTEILNTWPQNGTLTMRNVSLSYHGTNELALRGVSLDISSGERVGLCGRSGSGKSSMVQAILRMVDISSGQITIDGQNLSNMPRNEVRKRMSCLTQEPFLFHDTVRFNMDPTGEHDDESIVNALQRVGLWEVIASKSEAPNKLDEKMDDTFLSHGQRQMFCLGRALLKKSRFLILDEPTSNVDKQTDAQMQQIIREEFQDRTILMIAHRLDTLIDFDKVAVLNRGSIVEVGSPKELLDRGTVFAKLYHADGH